MASEITQQFHPSIHFVLPVDVQGHMIHMVDSTALGSARCGGNDCLDASQHSEV
ncbi:hypothetical protein F2Q70_00024957 [Brassica cretica]|uniref:BnaC04g08500D protein n=3 Tax=Brassica TaxID=3705 RepID=A0A078H6N6_BRANA|nr:hypothetical protein F2Q68_00024305 [Brassica cretica]KAF2602860.1 hypothetical protein F2Q70_00024957 [Brassica cretica]CDY33189.1 BnaC04g08500D [Brassica napus]VDD05975.1 unnamed protein product [Brassica oleracea]